MGETTHDSSSQAAGIDLSQFYQVFFEEAGENLDNLEQMLLNLDITAADDETLNAIFRCAHSVKGGAATFGFTDVAELTHQMETLLDKLRRHELQPTVPMVDVLLAAGDALRAMLARHQGSGGDPVETTELLFNIKALSDGGDGVAAAPASIAAPRAAAPVAAPAPAPAAAAPARPGQRVLELTVGPLPDPAVADQLVELFAEITDLGQIEPLDGGRSADEIRRFKITTTSSDNDLLDLFTFHVPREAVRLAPLGDGYGFHAGAPGAPTDTPAAPAPAPAVDPGYGFFDDAPGSPSAAAAPAPAPQPASRTRAAAGRRAMKLARGADMSSPTVRLKKSAALDS